MYIEVSTFKIVIFYHQVNFPRLCIEFVSNFKFSSWISIVPFLSLISWVLVWNVGKLIWHLSRTWPNIRILPKGCTRTLPYSECACSRLGQTPYVDILTISLSQARDFFELFSYILNNHWLSQTKVLEFVIWLVHEFWDFVFRAFYQFWVCIVRMLAFVTFLANKNKQSTARNPTTHFRFVSTANELKTKIQTN